MLESLDLIDGETVKVAEKAAIDSIRLADMAALTETTKIAGVLEAIVELPSVPRDEEYQFRKRSTDLLRKWNKLASPRGENQATTSAPHAVKKEAESHSGPIPGQVPSASPAIMGGKEGPERVHIRIYHECERCRGKFADGFYT